MPSLVSALIHTGGGDGAFLLVLSDQGLEGRRFDLGLGRLSLQRIRRGGAAMEQRPGGVLQLHLPAWTGGTALEQWSQWLGRSAGAMAAFRSGYYT